MKWSTGGQLGFDVCDENSWLIRGLVAERPWTVNGSYEGD